MQAKSTYGGDLFNRCEDDRHAWRTSGMHLRCKWCGITRAAFYRQQAAEARLRTLTDGAR